MTSLPQLSDLDDRALHAHYAPLRVPWFRLNFVATTDGAAQGPDGLSGTINNAADKRVFHALRDVSDVIIVGAGTARAEHYRPNPKPMVVVSRSGEVPPSLRERKGGDLLMATCGQAPHLEETRSRLGADNVLILGEYAPDLRSLRRDLVALGFRDLLCEGGPHLTRDLLAAGVVDELCLTTVPRLIADQHLRVAAGAPIDVGLRLHALLEDDGTLLARYTIRARQGH
ncbi:MAG TPA: dihydrofolate reductase family protein [Nocardioides sp.]|nr:dihydrofolate reductase family protein [Nocardioides sp.]